MPEKKGEDDERKETNDGAKESRRQKKKKKKKKNPAEGSGSSLETQMLEKCTGCCPFIRDYSPESCLLEAFQFKSLKCCL